MVLLTAKALPGGKSLDASIVQLASERFQLYSVKGMVMSLVSKSRLALACGP